MRSLGDLRWLNAYIGLPFVLGGRDESGLDCFGLVKLVYMREYGETLPDWKTDTLNVKCRVEAIESALCSGSWHPVESPQDGDIAVCKRTRAPHHLGIFFGGGVIHALEGHGVIYEPVSRLQERFTTVEFGEWRP